MDSDAEPIDVPAYHSKKTTSKVGVGGFQGLVKGMPRFGRVPGTGYPYGQYCGSMTFWCGSGSADPCLCLMDPDPSIFIIDLQDTNKKTNLKKSLSAYYFLKALLRHFSKIKCKKVTKQ
jgi:hypothetical protein